MKSVSRILVVITVLLSSISSFAQIKNARTETVKINGNCGMCKSNIENAVIQLIAEIVPYGSVSNSINTDNYMQLAQNSNDIAVKSCVKVNPNNNASLETYKTINLPISNLNVAQNIKIELIEEKFDDEKAMSEEAEIKLTLNEDLLESLKRDLPYLLK